MIISGRWRLEFMHLKYILVLKSSAMSSSLLLIELPFDCETSVSYAVNQLISSGFHVSRSFELDSACGSFSSGICVHDPKSPCRCQLVILQITDYELEPMISMIFHSYNGKTEIFLDNDEKITGQGIKDRIAQALDF